MNPLHRNCVATNLEMRVNFGGLKHPLPPFAIHILNRLDMRIHHIPYKIYHKKIEKMAIE